jgi:hypothetical protein
MNPAYVVPTDGVITKWGYSFSTSAGAYPVYPATFRGSGTDWTLTALGSMIPNIIAGAQSAATQMPVKAGDIFGMAGTLLYCADPTATITYGPLASGPTVGQSLTTTSQTGYAAAIWGTLEADVDHDGFGDETQDSCPQSAKFQTACPIASATAKPTIGKTAAVFKFAAPGESTITANASVKLPKTGKHKARTLKFKTKPLATLNGLSAKLTLKYPSALKSALKSLSKKKKLKLVVTIKSVGLNSTATKKYTLKLAGRKKS